MEQQELALLRKPFVLSKTGLCNSTMYYLIKHNLFPAPVKIGKRAVAWRTSDIETWLKNLSN